MLPILSPSLTALQGRLKLELHPYAVEACQYAGCRQGSPLLGRTLLYEKLSLMVEHEAVSSAVAKPHEMAVLSVSNPDHVIVLVYNLKQLIRSSAWYALQR